MSLVTDLPGTFMYNTEQSDHLSLKFPVLLQKWTFHILLDQTVAKILIKEIKVPKSYLDEILTLNECLHMALYGLNHLQHSLSLALPNWEIILKKACVFSVVAPILWNELPWEGEQSIVLGKF